MLFVAQWTVDSEQRVALWNAFGNMTESDHQQAEGPNFKKLGRWWTIHGDSGFCVFESDCMESVTNLSLIWSPFAKTCSLHPVADDSEFTKSIQETPFFEKMENKEIKENPLSDSTEKKLRYMVKWNVNCENKINLWNQFANMTVEDHNKTEGSINIVGRWHFLSGSGGIGLIECNSTKSILDCLLLWSSKVDFEVHPVNDDEMFVKCIKNTPFFESK